tara:strand:+ start:313 stop:513 length:201 start_codon:yes stop_codon:yes gene_type:complete
MKEKILFKRTIGWKGSALAVSIPNELLSYLGAGEGSEVCIYGDKGKHGKFISLWVKDDLEEKDEEE